MITASQMMAQKRAKKQAQQHDRKEKRAEKQAKEIQKIQVAQHWQALKMGKINRQAVTAAHLPLVAKKSATKRTLIICRF